MNRICTGNEALDRILGGGFPRNSINILMGRPGSGKTILAEQLAFANAGPHRPVLFLTTLSEPLSKMVTYLQEFAFARVELLGSQVLFESIAEELADRPEQLAERMRERIQQLRPAIILIDSFKAVSDMMPDSRTWRRVLFELGALLSAYDTTTFWIGEYTGEMTARLPEFAVADGILELSREQDRTRDERSLRVHKLRGSTFADGSHAFRIGPAGLDIFPRLVTPETAPGYLTHPERLRSGIQGLDEMIETGWLRGTTTLVAGPSGAGKTCLGLHFLKEGVEQGEAGLLVGYQENPTQLLRMIDSFGWDAGRLLGPGRLDIFYTSPVELHIDTIVREMLARIERHGVRRVLIDALSDLQHKAHPDRFRDYLYSLLQRFAVQNITALLCQESGTSGEPNELAHLTDNLLQLEMRQEEELIRTLRVMKSRGSAHSGRRHTLRIGVHGMEVS